MPVFKIDEKIILFIHIPKTGGKSVAEYLKRFGKRAFYTGKRDLELLPCSPQHLHYEKLDYLLNNICDHKFAVVRHPYKRVISEYKMRMRSRKMTPSSVHFNQWFERNIDIFQNTNKYHLDNHLRPQFEFISSKVKVYKFEKGMNFILRNISQDIGIKYVEEYIGIYGNSDTTIIELNNQNKNRLREIYAEDFIRFQYGEVI